MAKWGEGDPRWIVEERPDATNVNNWHWTEKNADAWSKQRLTELFTGYELEDPGLGARIRITEVQKCEGEARVNNRKAKLIFFYEWSIKLAWKGRLKSVDDDDQDEVEGSLEIPNLSEEHEDLDDVDIEVEVKSGDSKAAKKAGPILKEVLRVGPGAKAIRGLLRKYVDSLKEEYGKNLILPGKDGVPAADPNQKNSAETSASSALKLNKSPGTKVGPPPSGQLKDLDLGEGGCRILTATIEMTETFTCTGQELYNALTQRDMMRVFSGSDVQMPGEAAKKGDSFQLLGGNVQGSFLELVPFTRVTFKWRLRSWPDAHFSHVELTIKQREEDTKLILKQTLVPEKEVEATRSGWKRYYWDAIKRSFGFGFGLYVE